MTTSQLAPRLTLLDLTMIGIGGTIGSGVFVLTGMLAKNTGIGVCYSWILSGLVAVLSAGSYAELSYIKSSGSSYEYSKVLNSYLSYIAAWCLTLEYGISGAAVARSWGSKLEEYLTVVNVPFHNPGYNISIFGCLLQVVCTVILLFGVDIGKLTTNVFTMLKLFLIVLIIIIGFTLFNQSTLSANIHYQQSSYSGNETQPSSSILANAGISFFGFVGFDEVCSFSSEAINATDLPKAIFLTIIISTLVYILSGLALVGMQTYDQINVDTPFSSAFYSHNLIWAQHTVSIGELVTLPVVTFVSFLAQPRLFYQMSIDGYLPSIFNHTDSRGNLFFSILMTGSLLSVMALCIPFYYLSDMISAGILLNFSLTSMSLIVKRKGCSCKKHLCIFSALMLLLSISIACLNSPTSSISTAATALLSTLIVISSIGALVEVYVLHRYYPDIIDSDDSCDESSSRTFRVPLVPFIPLLGVFFNTTLLFQLSATSIMFAIGYFSVATMFYYCNKYQHFKSKKDEDMAVASSTYEVCRDVELTADDIVTFAFDDNSDSRHDIDYMYKEVDNALLT